MANEIQITATLRYSANGATASHITNFFADQTGDKYSAGIQTVGTAEEELENNDVGTIGYLAVKNMDDTNYVQFGASAGDYALKVQPGKGAVVAWSGAAVFAKANTAAVDVDYLMIEV